MVARLELEANCVPQHHRADYPVAGSGFSLTPVGGLAVLQPNDEVGLKPDPQPAR